MLWKKKKSKEKDLFHEELIQSPGRTALRNFLRRKLSIVGMVIFLFIFLGCFILSFLMPIDLKYTDSTRMNQGIAFNYLDVPKALQGNTRAISIGATFGAGVDEQGNLHLWGTMPDKVKNNVPADMGPLKLVSCGLDHVVAVNEAGEVFSWGNDRLNITKIPADVRGRNIVDVQAGYQVTLALDDKGTLHFWGNGNNYSIRLSGRAGTIADYAINISTAIALTKDGEVISLASKDTMFNNVPESVNGRAIAVASTDMVGAAVLDDHTVVTWGMRNAAALQVPDEIQGRVIDLAGGRSHFTALLDDGSLYGWGDNMFGQINAPSVTGYTEIHTDYYQNAAIDEQGNFVVWGQRGYLMGTDQWGRDVFTRLVHGGRITLTVGFISVIISGIIGVLIGGLSGYFGGKVDMVLMRLSEVVTSIPLIPLLIILSAIMANRIPDTGRVVMIMVILGLINWPGMARLTRAQILSERENEFVTAARAMGIRERIIIFRHILPNVMAVVLVSLTLAMATCLLIESNLSFLGFGIVEPTPTWGNMLNKCIDSIVIRNYWWRWVFPSLALGLAVISINVMGDGFRDAIDPKSNDR